MYFKASDLLVERNYYSSDFYPITFFYPQKGSIQTMAYENTPINIDHVLFR